MAEAGRCLAAGEAQSHQVGGQAGLRLSHEFLPAHQLIGPPRRALLRKGAAPPSLLQPLSVQGGQACRSAEKKFF